MRQIVCFAFLLLVGCAGAQEKALLKSQNNYAFKEARYEDRCVFVPAADPWCKDAAAALNAWKLHLKQATWLDPDAKPPKVPRAGARPEHMKQLRTDEKVLGGLKGKPLPKVKVANAS